MNKIIKIFLALILTVSMMLEIIPVNIVHADDEGSVAETAETVESPAEDEDDEPAEEPAVPAESGAEEEGSQPVDEAGEEEENELPAEDAADAASEEEESELPEEEPVLLNAEAFSEEFTVGDLTVSVSYEAGTVPEETEVVVSEADEEALNAIREKYGEEADIFAADISFYYDGEKIEPKDYSDKKVSVVLSYDGEAKLTDTVHVKEVVGEEGEVSYVVNTVDAVVTPVSDTIQVPVYEKKETTEKVNIPYEYTWKETVKKYEEHDIYGDVEVEYEEEVPVYETRDIIREHTEYVTKTREVEKTRIVKARDSAQWHFSPWRGFRYITEKYTATENYTEPVTVSEVVGKEEVQVGTEIVKKTRIERQVIGKEKVEVGTEEVSHTETRYREEEVGTGQYELVVTGYREETITVSQSASFEADDFSVYAIINGDDPSVIVAPRVTYHFLSELKSDGTADPYLFVNEAGETVDYQITKASDDGWELLDDPGSPVTGLEKNFLGWFVVTKNSDGTYSFPYGGTAIDFSVTPPVTTTVTEGDKDVYVAPRYGQAFVVTFWDNVKGSPTDQMHIVSKKIVYLDEGSNYASVRVDNVTVPTTATQTLSGWTSDDYKSGQQVTYTLLEKSVWDEVTQNFNLYPIFSEGHWLRFAGGPAGSGAGYRSAIFVTANTTASEIASLGVVAREGYNFAGWYYDGYDGTEAATDANGNALNAADLLARVQTAESDTTLYGHWTGKQVTYKVATWFENADNDDYSYGELTSYTGAAGTTTNVTGPSVSGFTVQTIEQKEIKGDGTTIVNVYYKRNLYSIYFYMRSYWQDNIVNELTITAKYGADIHDQWPSYKGYTAAWYNNSNRRGAWVISIATMPLNGANYYNKTSGNVYADTIFRVQNIDGSNTFTDYMSSPYMTDSTDVYKTADDYRAIKGFRVNANSQNDANQIRQIAGGDPDAVYDPNFTRSCAIGTSYGNGTRVLHEDGHYYYTLYFYYLRNQYDVSFNTQKSGAVTPNALEDIYYEANIASVKAAQIAALNQQYVVGETTVEVTGEGTYVFQGWYENADGMGDPFDFNQKMPAGNITLYAKWERVWYLIEIDPNGGEILPDINESTYTWLQYGDKVEQYTIRRDYVEATSDYSGTKYYYVSVLADDDPYNSGESDTYYWSGYRKGFYIKTTDINNSEYSWWKENGFIDTSIEYMLATTSDNYAFVGWYNKADDKVYDFNTEVTGHTAIYAKWRRSGLFSIQYHTENAPVHGFIDGSLVATDSSYADQASTEIAYTPTGISYIDSSVTDKKTYVFVGWKVADPNGFDPLNPGSATLEDKIYLQGDEFVIDASKADSGHFIHLVAVYEPAENNPDTIPVTTVTFDPNFPEDAGVTSGEKKTVEGVPVNTAIDLSLDSFTIKLPDSDDREETIPKFTAEYYIQTGWNTMADGTGTSFGLNDTVGVDNLDKTNNTHANTLYAVWEVKKFYLFHSSDLSVETITVKDLNDDGTYNLFEHTKEGFLYGGYYLDYAGKGDYKDDGVPGTTGIKYDGMNVEWSKDEAQTVDGTKMKPVAGETYYIKEVPTYYLRNYHQINYVKSTGQLTGFYLISAVDDLNYNETGMVLTAKGQKATVVNSLSFQNASTGTTVTLKANVVFKSLGITGDGSDKEYLTYLDVTDTDYFAPGTYTVLPYWVTPDGINVEGVSTRTITITEMTKSGVTKTDN